MRPLLVANYDFVMGGGEVGLRLLAEALVERGHRPLLAVPGRTPLFGVCEERSVPETLAAGALALRGLAAGCELLHVFSIRAALMAILANTAKPLIVHALIPNRSPYDPVVESFAAAILCNSRATAARFGEETPIVYNGVPRPRPTAKRLDLRPGRRTIAIIGNLCDRKGQLDALPALERVLAARADVDVAFAGRVVGPVALALQERAPAWNGRLRLLGFVPNIGDLLSGVALVLVPSRSEGFGRAAVEALRAGVPVLATRVEGLIEALQGLRDPWLPADRELWADRILRELERPTHSPTELETAALRFDPDRFTEEVLESYRRAVAGTIRRSCLSV
jgi:glycosyltransferase involved in cell wall biosynthesis